MTRAAFLTACIAWLTAVAPAWSGERGIATVVAKVKPSVVGVGTYMRARNPPADLRGTGFVVGDGLHVITNAHVLPASVNEARMESLAVFVPEGREHGVRQAVKIAEDQDHDIALLKIGGGKLPALSLGDSGKVREGDEYAFTGFPIGAVLGLFPVTHKGMVSAISPIATPNPGTRRLNSETIRKLAAGYAVFQLDATAYPGNSGSPMYDEGSGEVMGIINKVFVQATKENLLERPSGISYAIPINFAAALMKRAGVGPTK